MRIRVVWNPNAGSKAGLPTNGTNEAELRDLMARHGLGDDLVATGSEQEAIDTTIDAVRRGYDVVVGAGGDGTVGTVAFNLLNTETALGILPAGSAMNVARSLGIPRDLEGAAAILAAGNQRQIDVAEADGEPFLEVGSIGLNAALFAEAQRFDKGEYTSFFGLIRAMVRYRPRRMRIVLDRQVIRTRALMINVANGPFTGVGFTIAPDARMDDGLFDVRVFEGFSKWELVHHFWSIALGRRSYSRKVRTYRSARVHVHSRHPLPARVDAKDLGTTPVTFRTLTRALRVVAPPASSLEAASQDNLSPEAQRGGAGAKSR